MSYIHAVDDFFEQFDKRAGDLAADLQLLASLLFRKGNLIIAVTCSRDDFEVFAKEIGNLVGRLGDGEAKIQPFDPKPEARNEGLLAPSKVQYVYRAADYTKLGYGWRGRMEVLRQILSRDYLTQEIRIKGGAYGAWAGFTRDGLAYFGSYRDPNLKKTLDAFDGASTYLEKFAPSDMEMTRFIIGTIARLDHPKTPSQKGEVAVSYHLRGVTQRQRQAERDEILATRQQHVRELARMIKDILSHSVLCVYGNEKILQENKKLFERLVKVVD